VLVRPARPADAAAVAEAHVRSWQGAYEHVFGAEKLARIDVEARRAMWERAIAGGGVAVAEEESGRIVGFASVQASADLEGEGELLAIYVAPDAWGSSAGRELMDAAKDMLRASWSHATLWVLEDNPRARRFYEREGWQPDGAAKTDELLGVTVQEVRYRIAL
jgi:ribosomal protein S18 acetylase RimI-like enzyme